MKYLYKILAALPIISVAFSTVVLFGFSYEYHWLIIPSFFSLVGLIILAENYENIALSIQHLKDLLTS